MVDLTIRTTGVTDTKMVNTVPTQDYSGDANISVGEYNAGAEIDRGLIKFDLSGIPAGSVVASAVMSLYVSTDYSDNVRVKRVYRSKRAWTSAACWNTYSAGNSWTTAGCGHADDRETTDIGNTSIAASPSANSEIQFNLTASSIQQMINGGSFTNNGFVLITDTETNDMIQFHSTEATTEATTEGYRPKLYIQYTPPVGGALFYSQF